MEKQKEFINKLLDTTSIIIKDSGKTGIDDQIKFLEILQNNLINAPVIVSMINSLKELRSIKNKQLL